jgi:hypothetical protein
MEGSRRGRKPPLEVGREFVGFRLERQVLARVYELAVPLVREHLKNAGNPPVAESGAAERAHSLPLATGA